MAKKKSDLISRLKKKKKELKERGKGNQNLIFQKEGTLRVRLRPTGEENDFVFEISQFYLGAEIKGVISPASIGQPCAIMEKYEELRDSDDPDDKEFAKRFSLRKRFLAPVVVYSDSKGKKVDKDNTGKMVMLVNSQYEKIIDLFLDNDEWGDMTDPKTGYDLKLIRTGTGQYDTEYDVQPCKPTPIPKAYRKEIDLEAEILKALPSYEETVEDLDKFLSGGVSDDEDDTPKKKKKSKKKKRAKDI